MKQSVTGGKPGWYNQSGFLSGVRIRKCLVGAVAAWQVISLSCVHALAANTNPPAFGNPIVTTVKLFVSMALIVVMAVLFIRFLSKRTQVAQRGSIQVLAARQLAPNRSVQVIDVQGKKLLIGVAEQITLLADVTDSFLTEVNESAEGSFGSTLADALESVRSRYGNASNKERE